MVVLATMKLLIDSGVNVNLKDKDQGDPTYRSSLDWKGGE